ncbi:acetyl-CoA synthetase-like protein [Aspergillus taichungensis]|uniref:Acetyl-CoA synthetase-like protein n=1 Tax=Aspergillus taichungensis TaxID=482145 RepID=A0A2J5HH07_9EURO|nr:acetyl-CoA synthetase-like protein [Aspergillus taichungensis]
MTIATGSYANGAHHMECGSWRSLEASLPCSETVTNDPGIGQAVLVLSWIVVRQYYQQGIPGSVGILNISTSRSKTSRSGLRVLNTALDQEFSIEEAAELIHKQISESSMLLNRPLTKSPVEALFLYQGDDMPPCNESSAAVKRLSSTFPHVPIFVHCKYYNGNLSLSIISDASSIETPHYHSLFDQFMWTASRALKGENLRIQDLMQISPAALDRVLQVNKHVPERLDICVHDIVQERCRESPEAPAVASWDGTFTYSELDNLATNLASFLAFSGVLPETFVPVCMNKSKWTLVAILGILKAGAAFVLLDPSYPFQRLQSICQEVCPTILLSSEEHANRCSPLANVCVVEHLGQSSYSQQDGFKPPQVNGNNALYVAFTSGSTGKPKGVVIEHGSYCTGAQSHCQSFGIDRASRVLQFASYAFDVSIMESLSTIMSGGCVCVMSEAARTDPALFAQAAAEFCITHALLTPSFARMLPWDRMSQVKILILGGEKMLASDIVTFTRRGIRVFNAYGPAECSVNASVQELAEGCRPNTIGQPTGAVAWVVDPEDSENLMPLGAVGELIIEGPIVGRGYLNNAEASSRAFIESPNWLQQLRRGTSQRRMYRTGDLAYQDARGCLTIVGRKDEQVKVHGQRMELAEVEYHISQAFSDATAVIVEKTGNENLTGFILPGLLLAEQLEKSSNPLFFQPTSAYVARARAVLDCLRQRLPAYMVPTVLIPLRRVPRLASTKLDRALLRQQADQMSPAEIKAYISESNKSAPATEAEYAIRNLYTETLGVPPESIGMEDSLYSLGGDSFLAIKLVGAARQAGLDLAIDSLLRQLSLREQAVLMKISLPEQRSATEISPFSMIDPNSRAEFVRIAAEQCGLKPIQIQDIYPCTPMQEGMLAASLQTPGKYVGEIKFRLPRGTDTTRLKAAWQSTADKNPILCTRMVETGRGFLQVVVREKIDWLEGGPGSEQPGLGWLYLGGPLVSFRHEPHKEELTVIVHHALCDGWSIKLLQEQVEAAYRGTPAPKSQPFNRFVQYTESLSGADEFWRSQLAGLEATTFPALPSVDYRPSPSAEFRHTLKGLWKPKTGYTYATYLQLAWALLMAHYTDSEAVVFGVTSSGRSAPVSEVERLVGPTIASAPLHVHVEQGTSVDSILDQIQSRVISMLPHEQAGLQRISKCGPDAAKACAFQSQLLVQFPETPSDNDFPVISGTVGTGISYLPFASYALFLAFHIGEDNRSLEIHVSYDPKVLSTVEVGRTVCQYEHVLRQILQSEQSPNMPVNEIEMASPQDLQVLQTWNASIPARHNVCLHDLVLAQHTRTPWRTAVCSWDGNLSYERLDVLSSKLGSFINTLGVTQGSSVAICMEKSKWSVIAIFAVLRTGCACVLLDPKHPRQRIQEIMSESSAHLIITSSSTTTLTDGLCANQIELSVQFTEKVEKQTSMSACDVRVSPHDTAFILFTSGSTGRSKGIVMPHSTLATSIFHHREGLNVSRESRVLHHSSFAFDMSIYEIFTTMAGGGCVCIPSQFDKDNDLAAYINRARLNCAFFTPSSIQILRPSEVPMLRTVVLAGENVTKTVADPWTKERTLINGYGPAEATICGVATISEDGWKPGVIGRIVGGIGWVTKPSDPSKLAAIGAVGELLVEGSILARGYLNRPEAEAAAFLHWPKWRVRMHGDTDGTDQRLYRTGDLVQYDHDGSLRYIGRKDTQVKLRGQRIELDEVETTLTNVFPEPVEVVAEVIEYPLSQNSKQLTAIVKLAQESLNGKDKLGSILAPADAAFLQSAHSALAKLKTILPAYMVPSIVIPALRFPRTLTGKMDRRSLKAALLALSHKELQAYSLECPSQKEPAGTDSERQLQEIWQKILGIRSIEIGVNDRFLGLGGDSVAAMRMVAVARRAGFSLIVADVMGDGTLRSLARSQKISSSTSLSRCKEPLGCQKITRSLLDSGCLPTGSTILHAAPATWAQSFLIPRYPWTHFCFSFAGWLDLDCLEGAIARLTRAHSILRSLFLARDGERPLHVILDNLDTPLHAVTTTENVQDVAEKLCQSEQKAPVTGSVPPTRFTLITNLAAGQHVLLIRLAHAQYDGICIPTLLHDLESLCNHPEAAIQPTQFEDYLHSRPQNQNSDSVDFWGDYLRDSSITRWFRPSISLEAETDAVIRGSHAIELPVSALPLGITAATLVKAASAIAVARRTGTTDVVLGQTVHNRSLPIPGIDRIVGPCVNYVPFRVAIEPSMTRQAYLNLAQRQHTRSLGHEWMDLDQIVQRSTQWKSDTGFGFIVQHQNIERELGLSVAGNSAHSFSSAGRLYASSEIWICSTPTSTGMEIEVIASRRVLGPDIAQELADEIAEALLDLVRGGLDRSVEEMLV